MSLRDKLQAWRTFLKREWNYWRRTLIGCTIQPTYRCNLRCKMCGSPRIATPGDAARELTGDQMVRIVDELGEMGVGNLQLIGGEPFLRKNEMLAVAERARQRKIRSSIVTNGTLIDGDLAQQLVDVGVRRLVFSVDGVGAAHDRVRGPGAFERTKEAMRLVLEERRRRGSRHPVIITQTSISRLNCDQVPALFRFGEEIGADQVRINYVTEIPPDRLDATRLDGLPMCTDRWGRKGESLLLSAAEIRAFRASLERAPAGQDIEVLKSLDDAAYLQCFHPPRRCYFMRNIMLINPFGEALPCIQMDRFVMGNVLKDGLRAVWQNERHRRIIASLRKGGYPACSGCHYYLHNLSPGQHLRTAGLL